MKAGSTSTGWSSCSARTRRSSWPLPAQGHGRRGLRRRPRDLRSGEAAHDHGREPAVEDGLQPLRGHRGRRRRRDRAPARQRAGGGRRGRREAGHRTVRGAREVRRAVALRRRQSCRLITSTYGAQAAGRLAARPRLSAPSACVVEGSDERVHARVDAVRVRVPGPDVQRHEDRVPDSGRRAGLGTRLRAVGLCRRCDEGAVRVVTRGREGAVLRSRQRCFGRLLGEHPLERGELPRLAALLVDEDRRLVRVEAGDLRIQEVPAHVRDHPRDVDGVAGLAGRLEARRVLGSRETGLGDDRCQRLGCPVRRRVVVRRLCRLRPAGRERHGPCSGTQECEERCGDGFAQHDFPP